MLPFLYFSSFHLPISLTIFHPSISLLYFCPYFLRFPLPVAGRSEVTKSPGGGETIPMINQNVEGKVGGAVRLSVPEEKYVFRW